MAASHQQLRKKWARQVEAGYVDCARCRRPILPGQKWDLDHADDRNGYEGPAHVYCNRAAAARKLNALRRRRKRFSRRW